MNIVEIFKELEQNKTKNLSLHKELRKVIAIIELIENAGYEIYIVGGYVRDKELNKLSADVDLTTNMPIELAEKLFKEQKFQTKLASGDKETKVLIVNGIELAQFRKDLYENNQFIKAVPGTLKEDAERRDATINAMYEDIRGNIVDVMGGLEDLQAKVIRACGNPVNRIHEDESRILRYAYLAAKLGFSLDSNIINAVKSHKSLLKNIHPNLKGKIIKKAIQSEAFYPFLENLEKMDILFDLFPEFKNLKGLEQNPIFHVEGCDALCHVKKVVKKAEELRPRDTEFILGAFYHDVGKGAPEFIGSVSQPKHEYKGSPIAKEKMIEFGFGKDFSRTVEFFANQHGITPSIEEKSIQRWAKLSVGYASSRENLINRLNDLIDMKICDTYGFNEQTKTRYLPLLEDIRSSMPTVIRKYPFYISDLPIDGKFIIENSDVRGPKIGLFLQIALKQQITSKEALVKVLNNKRTVGAFKEVFI